MPHTRASALAVSSSRPARSVAPTLGRCSGLLLILAALVPSARAQEVPGTKEPPGQPTGDLGDPRYIQPTWKIQFQPSVWYDSPGGKLRFPGGSTEVQMQDINLDSPRISPYAELHLRDGNWRLGFSGSAVSLSDRGAIQTQSTTIGSIPIAAGDRTVSSFDFATFQAEVGYRLPVGGLLTGKNDPDFYTTWEVVGGLRLYDVDTHISAPAGSVSAHEFLGAPYLGFRADMEVIHGFAVELEASYAAFSDGGDESVFGGNVEAGFIWRPWTNVGLRAGYRMLLTDIKSGSGNNRFEWNGAAAGLFGGLTLRF